MTQDICLAAG